MKDSTELKFMSMFFAILATTTDGWFKVAAGTATIIYFFMWAVELWIECEKRRGFKN